MEKDVPGYEDDSMVEYDEEREEAELKEANINYVKDAYGKPGSSPAYLLMTARALNTVDQLLEMGLGEDDTGTSFADYNSIYSQIETLMKLDDVDQFAVFLTKYHDKLLSFEPQHIVYLAVTHSAVRCLTALLDSQLRSHVDLNKLFTKSAQSPLDIAAGKLSFGMVTLLLQHGADPDFNGCGLPLANALQKFSVQDDVCKWNPWKSFIELFIIISLPQMKESLDTVKVLASQSKQVEYLCFGCVKDGLIVEFATLLTAASDKLLAQIEKGLENTPVGQYIFGELKCEAKHLRERTSNGFFSSKEKNLVDGFSVIKSFCCMHGLDVSPGQLVLEASKFVHEKPLVREHANKDNMKCMRSKLTSEPRVPQIHFGSRAGGERRIGIAGLSTLPHWSHSPYQALYRRQVHFNHKLVETRLSECTLVKPSLVKNVALITRLVKTSFK